MLSSIVRGTSLPKLLFMIGAYAVIVFIVLPIHEFAHAFAAHMLGDDTAKWNGRLTLNPLRHLDLFGTVMIVLFGVGYAKPVPVNPYNFRNRKRDMALCALAGPLSNIVMAIVSVAIFRVCCFFVTSSDLLVYLYLILIDVFASVNIGLAVFNLLPVPPLDGFEIFSFFLPERWVDTLERYNRQISMGIMLLLFVGVLDVPLAFLRGLLGNLIGAMFGMPGLF